ncbi:transglutaminase-like domain-containing protein [Rhodoferax koreense]|nr:transglutaminase family protein [Rhodoferax koreense]
MTAHHLTGPSDTMTTSNIDATLDYEVQQDTHFLFNLEAAHHSSQRIIEESLTVSPPVQVHHFMDDSKGNRFFRFDAQPGKVSVRYKAKVELVRRKHSRSGLTQASINALPDAALHYLLPTRFCESDLMSRAAQQQFGGIEPGIKRVEAVVDWVHDNVAYMLGSSDATTTAQQVFVQRAGVCRDFAHLAITFCRALNIPARLVVGYVEFEEPPQDFHAIFEAWLGDRWVLFDPTKMAPVEKLVRVGSGRDAKDVAFATLFGAAYMTGMLLDVYDGRTRPATNVVPIMAAGQKQPTEPPVSETAGEAA